MLFLCVFLLLCLLVDSESSLERKALSFLCRDCFRSDSTANADFDPCVRSAFSVIFYVRFLCFPTGERKLGFIQWALSLCHLVALCSDWRAETGFYPVGLIFVPPCYFVFRPASGNWVLSSRPYLCASFLLCVPIASDRMICSCVNRCVSSLLCVKIVSPSPDLIYM